MMKIRAGVCSAIIFFISFSAVFAQRNFKNKTTLSSKPYYQRVSASVASTLEIRDGTLWAWGYNQSGELGDGTTTSKTKPVQIGKDNNWAATSMSCSHSIGLKTDGTLWAWGQNTYGELGDGTTVDKNSPVQIGSDNNWVNISAGCLYSMAIKSDGTLWACGFNNNGQLGDGTKFDKTKPV